MLYDHIIRREAIDRGWSGDRKFKITDDQGQVYLLRLSPAERFERKAGEFRRMEQAAGLGIPMCRPLEFGRCPEGVYSIQSWIDGQDAEEALAALPAARQYACGCAAGGILRQLHSLPAPAAEDWALRFGRKIDRKIAMYEACPLKYEGGEAFLHYLADKRHLLQGRPQSYQHGDYHVGNMMLDRDGVLHIIDFEKDDYGDPWEEFNRIVWSAQSAPAFASGMVDGYFPGGVPLEFWELLALYICSNTLSSLPWAIPYGPQEVEVMRRQGAAVLDWYDQMRQVVPGWYAQGGQSPER